MAKKKASETTPELPGVVGEGVAPLSIPEIDKQITKYERAKDARCNASPGEVEAKKALRALLHQNAAALPVNEDGNRFYRLDGVDYILEEKLKRRSADDDDGGTGED